MKPEDILPEKVDTHTLTLLARKKCFSMGKYALENLSVEKVTSLFENELLYAMRTLIPAENVCEEEHTLSVKCPFNWKEAFKEQHFPKWLKALFPIKYKTKTETAKFTVFDMYPEFPVLPSDFGSNHIRHTMKITEGEEEYMETGKREPEITEESSFDAFERECFNAIAPFFRKVCNFLEDAMRILRGFKK
jgi:hypothetical protein